MFIKFYNDKTTDETTLHLLKRMKKTEQKTKEPLYILRNFPENRFLESLLRYPVTFNLYHQLFQFKFSIIPLFQSVYLTIHQHSPGYIFTEKPPPKNLYHEKDQWELLEIYAKNDQTHTQYLNICL